MGVTRICSGTGRRASMTLRCNSSFGTCSRRRSMSFRLTIGPPSSCATSRDCRRPTSPMRWGSRRRQLRPAPTARGSCSASGFRRSWTSNDPREPKGRHVHQKADVRNTSGLEGERMATPERYDALVLGSGQGGKLLAWDLARSGRRTAVVERRWIGGSCPNINCMPSKNEIWSANVAYIARHAAEFGAMTDRVAVDMAKVRQRKREMVDRQVDGHLRAYKDSGAELIMGTGRFLGPKTLEVRLNDGGTRVLHADKVFINVGTRATMPDVQGLDASGPLTS